MLETYKSLICYSYSRGLLNYQFLLNANILQSSKTYRHIVTRGQSIILSFYLSTITVNKSQSMASQLISYFVRFGKRISYYYKDLVLIGEYNNLTSKGSRADLVKGSKQALLLKRSLLYIRVVPYIEYITIKGFIFGFQRDLYSLNNR